MTDLSHPPPPRICLGTVPLTKIKNDEIGHVYKIVWNWKNLKIKLIEKLTKTIVENLFGLSF